MITEYASGAPRITGTGSPRSEPRSGVLEIPQTKRRRPTLNAFSAIEVLVPYTRNPPPGTYLPPANDATPCAPVCAPASWLGRGSLPAGRSGMGLTRFDGHPRSGDTARKGCPSWRPWETGDEHEDRSPPSTRPRWSSCAARAASRSPRLPVTSIPRDRVAGGPCGRVAGGPCDRLAARPRAGHVGRPGVRTSVHLAARPGACLGDCPSIHAGIRDPSPERVEVEGTGSDGHHHEQEKNESLHDQYPQERERPTALLPERSK